MALPCDDFNLAEFVDRESELEILLQKVSFSANPKRSEERVLHLIGKSDIGKSFLLCKYHDHLVSIGDVESFFISFEPFFGLPRDQFVARILDLLYNRIVGVAPVNNIRNNVKHLADDLKRELDILQRRKPVVFLMDEVNILSSDQIEDLEDYFLSHCISLPNTVLILTGRHSASGWKDFPLRPTHNKNVIELLRFDLDYTQEQIEILNPNALDLAPKIFEISGGSPGNNKKILDQARGNPLQINDLSALRACNQELYDEVAVVGQTLPQEIATELLPALEALCVLQDFDKEYEMPVLLAAHPDLNGIWDVKRSASLFNILSGIQVGRGRLVDWDKGKGAYAIEEQIRLNLEKELMIRDKDLWKTLHCTAMKMYAQWVNDYPDTDIFAGKSEDHKTQLGTAGFDPDNC
jgi:hypothetical protein